MATNFDLEQIKTNVEAAKAAGKLGPFITKSELNDLIWKALPSVQKLTNLLNEHYEKRIDKLTRPRRTW